MCEHSCAGSSDTLEEGRGCAHQGGSLMKKEQWIWSQTDLASPVCRLLAVSVCSLPISFSVNGIMLSPDTVRKSADISCKVSSEQ